MTIADLSKLTENIRFEDSGGHHFWIKLQSAAFHPKTADVYYRDEKCDNIQDEEHHSLLHDILSSSMATESGICIEA